VEINPETARQLDLHERDLVEIESPRGKIQAPVYIYPGLAPEMVAMPLGQGHTAFGQYASGHGASPLSILAPTADSQAGALAYGATRVKLTKVAGRGRLITIEGRAERQPGRAFFEGVS
jgi:molybdopterin-containing oxidoreductase family iron-sulfur binding subunit